jgi:hypothetical protein
MVEGSGPALSSRMHDSPDFGQSLRPYFSGDQSVSSDQAQPIQICAHAQAWFLAEPGRDIVWENGANLLRHIRVQSWQELRDRILKGIAEINANPVVHRWRKFDALTTEGDNTDSF